MPAPDTIVLGGGCFWCTEAIFAQLPGVLSVVPGYAGGTTKDPTYEQVCTGATGHAEVVQVHFDPEQISLEKILAVFLALHDPTTPDRQGAYVGTQYRSIILSASDAQQEIIEQSLQKAQDHSPAPIVTELKRLEVFTPAEVNHRQYYERNKEDAYCQVVIAPKLEKLERLLGA